MEIAQYIQQCDQAVKDLRALRRMLASYSRLQAHESGTPIRAFQRLEKQWARMAPALDPAVQGIAQAVLTDLGAHVQRIQQERADVQRRRHELNELAGRAGKLTAPTGTRDEIGPFSVTHTANASAVHFGKIKLQSLPTPSGQEVLDAVLATEKKLETAAARDFESFARALETAQKAKGGDSDLVSWPHLVDAAVPDAKERKALQRVLVYRLAMLVSRRAPGGWTVAVTPVTLAEQRAAWVVPRLDQAGQLLRVYRVRVNPPVQQG